MRAEWEESNRRWQSRVRAFFAGVQRSSRAAQDAVLESVQTALDHVEATFEPVMLPPSKGKLR